MISSTPIVPLLLEPNPWNPNRMDEQNRTAQRESIERYGFIDPVTAYPHPNNPDRYQIIDGEHRWKIALELDLDTIPVIVLNINESEAERLTIALNDISGTNDPNKLAELFERFAEDDDPLNSLPYDTEYADRILQTLNTTDPLPPLQDDPWTTITMRVPQDVAELFEDATLKLLKDYPDITLNPDPNIAHGQALEILSAEYLAT